MKKETKRRRERTVMKKKAKRERLLLALSVVPPFAFTVTLIILYAFKLTYAWLFITTSILWFALGTLFTVSAIKRWGCFELDGSEKNRSTSVVTTYNTVLIFALAVLFLVLFIRKII